MGSLRSMSPIRGLLLFLPLVLAVAIAACASQAAEDPGASGQDGADAEVSAEVEPEAETEEEVRADDELLAEPEPEPESAVETTQDIEPLVYADDFSDSIQPIFADRCSACHGAGGPGTAHWVLTTAGELAAEHDALAEAVATGYMPPWPAGGDSPEFHEDRSLRQDQIQAILDWSAAGGPLDVAPDTVIEPLNRIVGLADPDMVLTPAEPYGGSTAITDDYRCQIYDPQLPDGGWITGYEFIPDKTEVVHHAIGYMLPASARTRAAERDGEDGRPGWSCFGSSGLGRDDIFIGWAPGQDPTEMPAGTGLWVEPGAFVVVQIHYHYEAEVPEDLSELALNVATEEDIAAAGGDLAPISVAQYIAPAEIPCSTEESGPLCDRDAAMAAAIERYGEEGVQADRFLALCRAEVEDFAAMTDGTASSSCDIPVAFVGGTGEIISVLGHEHEIGSWFKMTLNPGQPGERVLLDIPNWNFDWQYNYRPVDKIVLDADDVVRIECGWDRARRDKDLEPAYVLWADGTDDEMCFATISTRPAT